MKANYMNYFQEGKLYQWDKDRMIFTIEDAPSMTFEGEQQEFCLDQKGMEMFLRFPNPIVGCNGKTLNIKSEKLKARIPLVDETLVIPDLDFKDTFKVDVAAIKKASKFVAQKGKHPILEGVSIRGGYVQATDSFMAYRSQSVSGDAELILPLEFVNILPSTGVLEMRCRENSVACAIDNKLCISKLIAGKYSNLEQVFRIPSESKSTEVDTDELKNVLSYSMNKEDKISLYNGKAKIYGVTDFEADIDLSIENSFNFTISRFKAVIDQLNTEKSKISYIASNRPVFFNEEYLLLPIKEN